MSVSKFENHSNPRAVDQQLEQLAVSLGNRHYPGYPSLEDRLSVDLSLLSKNAYGDLIVPDGPWTVNEHTNRKDTETVPGGMEQLELLEKEYFLDSAGRPLHPWFIRMIEDPSIGVVTGKGAYWKWGPNLTADPIIISGDNILLIKRSDTGVWALPGGHVDDLERPVDAALREAREETGLLIPDTVDPVVIYDGPVVDIRATANAWPETTAVLLDVGSIELPDPKADDDALAAQWFPIKQALASDDLHGSHRFLIRRAAEVKGIEV